MQAIENNNLFVIFNQTLYSYEKNKINDIFQNLKRVLDIKNKLNIS